MAEGFYVDGKRVGKYPAAMKSEELQQFYRYGHEVGFSGAPEVELKKLVSENDDEDMVKAIYAGFKKGATLYKKDHQEV